jgi:hypothetical protein
MRPSRSLRVNFHRKRAGSDFEVSPESLKANFELVDGRVVLLQFPGGIGEPRPVDFEGIDGSVSCLSQLPPTLFDQRLAFPVSKPSQKM